MIEDRIISADSHIVETADFWIRHIETNYRDRAPHAHTDENGNVYFIVDKDKPLGSVGAPAQAGVRFEDPEKVTFEGSWADVRPGCADPEARLEDMAIDGVTGEVIYPTLGARLYGVIGGDLLSACLKAGNDWLITDFCSANPQVFKGVAALNVDDVQEAVAELTRCVTKGLCSGMFPTYPGEAHPYHESIYEPLWAAAQDLDVPLSLHIASNRPGPGQMKIFAGEWQSPKAAAYSATQDYWVRRAVASMIFAGVFERFPRLRVVIVEHELSWAPYFLDQMDKWYKELSQTAPYRFKDGGLPSDFFRTNIFLTFQEDKRGIKMLREMIGTDTLMWGSDYPHMESTWPHSRRFLDDIFSDMSEEDRRKMTRGTAAASYKFN